jgi:predicted nucleotidyltransferase component of viral defense system
VSQTTGVEAEVVLRNFMMERLLERISTSEYRDNFILKGGLLIASMVGIDIRSTMDMDTTVKGRQVGEDEIVSMIKDIIDVPVDDNVTLSYKGVREIREEADYPGFRISLEAALGKTRQTLKVDITAGDFVTPNEIEYSYSLMFEDRAIRILAYNTETVLAEKFETIITRGVANTRMRDFYDVYILTATQSFDDGTFRDALGNTISKRGSARQMGAPGTVIETVATNSTMSGLWQRYQSRNSYAAGVSWRSAIDALYGLAKLL